MNAIVQHQSRPHARLGGSAAPIFTVCTGAPALWAGRERRSSSFAREGTLAHELAEKRIKDGDKAVPPVGASFVVEGEAVTVDHDMLAAIDSYISIVKALRVDADWVGIEQNFTLDDLWKPKLAPEPLHGTSDFAAVRGRVLTVLDLKFGKGVLVKAEGSAQLLYYGLGVYLKLRREDPELAAQIDTVRLGICQPRMRDDVDWWDVPLIDLLLWADNVLKKSVDAIQTGRTSLVAGRHCQFCVAKPACPALAQMATQAAKGVFPPPDPKGLSDDELGKALEQAEMLSIWMSAIRTETETRIAHGKTIPGWKLVDKKGYRQWSDPEMVINTLTGMGFSTSDFMETPELRSPAQIEKRLKANGCRKDALDAFITTPSTGTTLVPDTDKRPAVTSSPQSVFPSLEDNSQ